MVYVALTKELGNIKILGISDDKNFIRDILVEEYEKIKREYRYSYDKDEIYLRSSGYLSALLDEKSVSEIQMGELGVIDFMVYKVKNSKVKID